jgi:hypothetical protein
VIQGTLMVIPIEGSLIYVRPLYLRAQAGRIPELTRVIVAYQNRIVMEPTLDLAMARLFGQSEREAAPAKPGETAAVPPAAGTRPPAGFDAATWERLAMEARDTYRRASMRNAPATGRNTATRSRSSASSSIACVRSDDATPISRCLSRAYRRRHGHRQQSRRLEHRVLAAAPRRMGRLDADGSDLSVLPLIVGTSIGLGMRQPSVATILRRGAIIWGLGCCLPAFRSSISQPSASPVCWRGSRGATCRPRYSRARSGLIRTGAASCGRASSRCCRCTGLARCRPVPRRIRRRSFSGRQHRRLARSHHLRRACLARRAMGSGRTAQHDAGDRDNDDRARSPAGSSPKRARTRNRARAADMGIDRHAARPVREHVAADQQEPVDQLVRAVHRRLAAACLAVCYWLCDARESPTHHRITEPFVALGRNAILLFVLSGLLAKTLIYLKWPDPDRVVRQVDLPTAFLPIARRTNASLLTRLQTSPYCSPCSPSCTARRIYLTV